MADAGRVGNRTNGLSSALQLHHPSSLVGQTDGIALSGVQALRKPMDHAITDSHSGVTISHSWITSPIPTLKICNTGQPSHCWTEPALPGLVVPYWHDWWACPQESPYVLSVTLEPMARIGTIVPAPSGIASGSLHRRVGSPSVARRRQGANASAAARNEPLGSAAGISRRGQLANCSSRMVRQRSVRRSYASEAAAPEPSLSAARPSATSAAERSSARSASGMACTRPP